MRRLKLLPEVLPPPNTTATTAPRARTRERLAALMAVAATAACSREDPVSIKPEDPSKVKKTPNTDPTATTTTTTTASVASVTPTSVPTPPSYMVVDPLPPPAMCAGLSSTIKASAAWKTGATGSFLELKLDKPTMSGAKYGKTPLSTPVYGGKLLSIAPGAGDGLVVQVVPDPTAKYVYVYISAACPAGTERVYAEMSFTSAGGPVKVTLSDVY